MSFPLFHGGPISLKSQLGYFFCFFQISSDAADLDEYLCKSEISLSNRQMSCQVRNYWRRRFKKIAYNTIILLRISEKAKIRSNIVPLFLCTMFVVPSPLSCVPLLPLPLLLLLTTSHCRKLALLSCNRSDPKACPLCRPFLRFQVCSPPLVPRTSCGVVSSPLLSSPLSS